jgi:hypothetical protein
MLHAAGEQPVSATSGDEPIANDPAVFAAILQQNWENVRHIKSERVWYLNTHAVTRPAFCRSSKAAVADLCCNRRCSCACVFSR